MSGSLFDRLQAQFNASASPFYVPPIDLENWESNFPSEESDEESGFVGGDDGEEPRWLEEARQQARWVLHPDPPIRGNIDAVLDVFAGGPPSGTSPPKTRLTVEAIAWYRSWRSALHRDDWGIFLNVQVFAEFLDDVWSRAVGLTIPWTEFRWSCWRFVWAHEANHYDVDLALALLTTWTDGALQPISRRACRHEESLGQSRGLGELGRRPAHHATAEAITRYFESSRLRGYGDLTTWTRGRGPKHVAQLTDADGIECAIGHRLEGRCDSAVPWLRNGRLLRPGKSERPYGSGLVPVHLVLPATLAPSTFASLTRIAAVHVSPRAKRTLKKLHRSDKRLAEAWEETLRMLLTDPNHPSLRLQPFKGSKPEIWEVRIDRGNRALLERDALSKEMTVLDIGNDLYDH